jgi:hypothetical protein
MPKAKNPNMGRPVLNKHKVPLKQWRKWPNLAKKVFNNMMESMRPSLQWAFLHPSAAPQSKEHWQTVRWNAAWTAACAVGGEGPLAAVVNVNTQAPKKRAKKVLRRVRDAASKPEHTTRRKIERAVDKVVARRGK